MPPPKPYLSCVICLRSNPAIFAYNHSGRPRGSSAPHGGKLVPVKVHISGAVAGIDFLVAQGVFGSAD